MRRVLLGVVLVFAVFVAVVGFLLSRGQAPDEPEDSPDLTIEVPRGNLYGGPRFGRQLDVSPDGQRIVYVGQEGKGSRRLFGQKIGEAEPAGIPETGAGNRDIRDPTFSPDGRYVAYWAQGNIKKITLDGKTVSERKAPSTRGIAWLDTDTLIIGNPQGALLKVSLSAAEEAPLPLVQPTAAVTPHVSPNILPGNKAVLFTIAKESLTDARIAVLLLDSGEVRELFDENAFAPRYLPSGYIVFGHGANRQLMAARFDLSKLQMVGSPKPVLSVPLAGTGAGGATDYAVSETGVLVYAPRREVGNDTVRAWFGDPTTIHVRLRWFEELNRLMP